MKQPGHQETFLSENSSELKAKKTPISGKKLTCLNRFKQRSCSRFIGRELYQRFREGILCQLVSSYFFPTAGRICEFLNH